MYRSGKWPEIPDRVQKESFKRMVHKWVRLEDANGPEILQHKSSNKSWIPEERLALIMRAVSGNSIRSTTFENGINEGMLYQWVRKYESGGYTSLVEFFFSAMGFPKSTYYFEIKKSDAVAEHNKNLLNEIRDIFAQNKRRYGVR